MLSIPLKFSLLILVYLQCEDPNTGDALSKLGAILLGGDAVGFEAEAVSSDSWGTGLLADIFRSLQ